MWVSVWVTKASKLSTEKVSICGGLSTIEVLPRDVVSPELLLPEIVAVFAVICGAIGEYWPSGGNPM